MYAGFVCLERDSTPPPPPPSSTTSTATSTYNNVNINNVQKLNITLKQLMFGDRYKFFFS